MNVPGLAGYLGGQKFQQDRETANLQQQGMRDSLAAALRKKQEADQIKQIMVSSSSPDEAMQKLSTIGPHGIEAATKIAQLQEHQGKVAQTQALAATTPDQLKNPDYLRKLAQVTRDPRWAAEADRLDKLGADAATLEQMKGGATQPSDGDVMGAVGAGAPMPQPTRSGGIFDALAQSQNPEIAREAAALKARLEVAGPNTPTAYFQSRQKQLADKEISLLNRPEKSAEPLQAVMRNGKGILVPRSEAVGAEPYSPSIAGAGAMEPETLRLTAEQYLAGDRQAVMGYARNATMRAALQNEIAKLAKEKGWKGADIAAQMADYAGVTAGSRTVGQRAAQISLSATEAEKMIGVAEAASKAFERTNFVPANAAIKAFQENTGSPEVKAFGASLNSLVNVYARAISPSGVPTVSDKDHARELIRAIDSPAQFAAVMSIMKQELAIAKAAPGEVREATRASVAPKPQNAPAAPVAAPGGSLTPAEAAELAALKKKHGR